MKLTRLVILISLSCLPFFLFLKAQKNNDTIGLAKLFKKIEGLESVNMDSVGILSYQSYQISTKANYKRGIGVASRFLGSFYLAKGNFDSSLLYLRKATDVLAREKDFFHEANAYIKMSYLFRKKAGNDSAYFYLFEANKLYTSLKDSLGIAQVISELGELDINYGSYKEAKEKLTLAASILTRFKDSLTLSKVLNRQGFAFYYEGDKETAIKYFLKAKEFHEALHLERLLAYDYNFLGSAYQYLEKDKLSREYLGKALAYFKKHDMASDMAEVLYNIGIGFYNADVLDSSIYYFEKILLLPKQSATDYVALQTYSSLSDAYAEKGNYKKAYNYQVKYTTLNDSLLNNEKIKQIAEMRTRYETEKKEQQIILLNEQNRTKLAQRNFFIAGTAILLLILLGLSFYYTQRHKIVIKNEQIAQEKISSLLKEQEIKSYDAMIEGQEEERKRIATDLHDRLGSMLSTVKLLFGNLNEKIDIHQADNQKQYDKASSLLDEAVLEVRRIAQNLSTGMVITFGLIPALEEFCDSIRESKLLKCKFLCYGIDERMEQHIEIGIFRMMQEIVNNVLKHAKAKNLTIQINRTEDSISVTVEDDGVGFNVQEKSKGMGLKNLETRAFKMGGTYNVDSKPGYGTISIIEIPLTHDTSLNS